MRFLSRSVSSAVCLVGGLYACAGDPGSATAPPGGDDGGGAPDAASSVPDAAVTTEVRLDNGVVVSADCALAPDYTIVYAAEPSHPFLGYGVNIKTPTTDADVARAIADMKALGTSWVKTDPTLPYKVDGGPVAPIGVSDADMVAAVRSTLTSSWTPVVVDFYKAMHAAGIRIVSTMFGAPTSYKRPFTQKDGSAGDQIDPARIGDFAQFYVAYFRVMNELGITPDVSELQNEPNGGSMHWTADQFTQFVAALEQVLARNPDVVGNISTAGNCAPVSDALAFSSKVADAGLLPVMKAVTLHTYYMTKTPNNGGIPSADDTDYTDLFAIAKNANLPLLVTEYGGTDLQTKEIDPGLESVNPAEELKTALDVVRAGASAAMVWILYPNQHGANTLKTWALVDEKGPTNAYWPMKVLAPNIPPGASVLRVASSDVPHAITSPGHAAFRNGSDALVALANPSPRALTIAVDLADAENYAVTTARSFTATGLLEKETDLRRASCPLRVTLPGDPDGSDRGTGVVLNLRAP